MRETSILAATRAGLRLEAVTKGVVEVVLEAEERGRRLRGPLVGEVVTLRGPLAEAVILRGPKLGEGVALEGAPPDLRTRPARQPITL